MSLEKIKAGHSLIFSLIDKNDVENITYFIKSLSIYKPENIIPTQEKKESLTPLLYALKQKKYDIVALLLSTPYFLSLRGEKETAFHIAIKNNAPFEVLKQLSSCLSELEIKNLLTYGDSNGSTALLAAFEANRDCPLNDFLPTIELLLEKGADVNIADKKGIMPIHLAALYDDANLIERLATPITINAQAIVIFPKIDYVMQFADDFTPLQLAVIFDNNAVTKKLIELGANPAIDLIASTVEGHCRSLNPTDKLALYWSKFTKKNSINRGYDYLSKKIDSKYTTKFYLAHKSNSSALNQFYKMDYISLPDFRECHFNLLHIAITKQNIDLIAYLLELKDSKSKANFFDPNVGAKLYYNKDTSTSSPLSIAFSIDGEKEEIKKQIVHLLLNSGADINDPLFVNKIHFAPLSLTAWIEKKWDKQRGQFCHHYITGRYYSNVLDLAIHTESIYFAKLAFENGAKMTWKRSTSKEMNQFLTSIEQFETLEKTILVFLLSIIDDNKKIIYKKVEDIKSIITMMLQISQLSHSFITPLLTCIDVNRLLRHAPIEIIKVTRWQKDKQMETIGLLPLLISLQIDIDTFFLFVKPEFSEELRFGFYDAIANGLIYGTDPLYPVSAPLLLQLKQISHNIKKSKKPAEIMSLRVIATHKIQNSKGEIAVVESEPFCIAEIENIISLFETQLEHNSKIHQYKSLGLNYLLKCIELAKVTKDLDMQITLSHSATHTLRELESSIQISDSLSEMSFEPLSLEELTYRAQQLNIIQKETYLSVDETEFVIVEEAKIEEEITEVPVVKKPKGFSALFDFFKPKKEEASIAEKGTESISPIP